MKMQLKAKKHIKSILTHTHTHIQVEWAAHKLKGKTWSPWSLSNSSWAADLATAGVNSQQLHGNTELIRSWSYDILRSCLLGLADRSEHPARLRPSCGCGSCWGEWMNPAAEAQSDIVRRLTPGSRCSDYTDRKTQTILGKKSKRWVFAVLKDRKSLAIKFLSAQLNVAAWRSPWVSLFELHGVKS